MDSGRPSPPHEVHTQSIKAIAHTVVTTARPERGRRSVQTTARIRGHTLETLDGCRALRRLSQLSRRDHEQLPMARLRGTRHVRARQLLWCSIGRVPMYVELRDGEGRPVRGLPDPRAEPSTPRVTSIGSSTTRTLATQQVWLCGFSTRSIPTPIGRWALSAWPDSWRTYPASFLSPNRDPSFAASCACR